MGSGPTSIKSAGPPNPPSPPSRSVPVKSAMADAPATWALAIAAAPGSVPKPELELVPEVEVEVSSIGTATSGVQEVCVYLKIC